MPMSADDTTRDDTIDAWTKDAERSQKSGGAEQAELSCAVVPVDNLSAPVRGAMDDTIDSQSNISFVEDFEVSMSGPTVP